MKKNILFIILLFFISSTAFAAPDINTFLRAQAAQHDNVTVKKIVLKEMPDKGLIIIEDAHCNLPVQREQMKIIRDTNAGLFDNGIALEPLVMQEGGAYGLIDTNIIKEGKGPQELDDYLAEKLKQGQIGAAEFLHVKYGGFKFAGIEDATLYQANYDSFLGLTEDQDTIETIMDEIARMLADIEEITFTETLKEFYNEHYRALAETGTLERYLDEIEVLILQYSIDMAPYPAFKKLLDVIGSIRTLDQKMLAVEHTALNKAQDKQVDEEGIIQLYRKGELTVGGYPQLFKYARLKELLLNADMLSFVREKDALEDILLRSIAYTDEDKELVRVLKDFEILHKMLTLQLTREEYEYFINERRSLERGNMADVVLKYVTSYFTEYVPAAALTALYENAVTFYEAVNRRDDALTRNILQIMQEQDARIGTAVLGGFHTDGITERLKVANISYVVLTPDAARVDPNSMVKYYEVMQDFRDGIEK
ncbi:MAG: hypothetical protein JW938_06685 [Candidatus Omnitrophica bacterium]|nr:hypothetical protein [Candidatus Omnitrophota bacterium]